MPCTCCLEAAPFPVTARFTSRGEYSNTSAPKSAAAPTTTPPSGRLAREPGEDVVRDLEVGVDLLNVVMLLQRVDQPEDAGGVLLGYRHGRGRHLGQLGARDPDARALERLLHLVEGALRGQH